MLLNQGNGAFAPPVRYEAGAGARGLALADLDLDGDLDAILVNNYEASVSMLLNQGDGTFLPHVRHTVGLDPLAVAVEDLDGDGDLDVAVANRGDDTVSLLFNQGGGALAALVVLSVGDRPWSVVAADLDSDGDFDLAVANNRSDDVSVLSNQGKWRVRRADSTCGRSKAIVAGHRGRRWRRQPRPRVQLEPHRRGPAQRRSRSVRGANTVLRGRGVQHGDGRRPRWRWRHGPGRRQVPWGLRAHESRPLTSAAPRGYLIG